MVTIWYWQRKMIVLTTKQEGIDNKNSSNGARNSAIDNKTQIFRNPLRNPANQMNEILVDTANAL